MPRFSSRKLKRLCTRCYTPCENANDKFSSCDGCTRLFHYKCLIKSKKHQNKKLASNETFFCSIKCELSIFPFVNTIDKEFIKINANEIKVPCTKCGGECHRFDRIQCDECDKWTHQVCSSLTKEEFVELGQSTDPFICSKKCEMKKFPFSNLAYRKFLQRNDEVTNNESELTSAVVAKQCAQKHVTETVSDEPRVECNYIDIDEVSDLGLIHGTKTLSIFHSNVASISKNKYKIEELFRNEQKLPDIIGVTETRIKKVGNDCDIEDELAKDIKLEGYEFKQCPTTMDAGGAGIYISKDLDYDDRSDLYLNLDRCENVWIQLKSDETCNTKNSDYNNLVIGVVYRHPGSQFKEFENRICSLINALNENHTNFVIIGDMNVNLLKRKIVTDIWEYHKNIQGAGCLSLIDRATRVVLRGSRWQSSCPDHIYSNLNIDNIESGIITSVISDHFSTFVNVKNVKSTHIPKRDIFIRKKSLSPVELANFKCELRTELNKVEFSQENVDNSTEKLIRIFQNLSDKYMPFKKLTRREKSFFFKPWLSSGIRKSMDTRDSLQKRARKAKNENLMKEYKKYKNYVTRLQNQAYSNFFSNKIIKNFKNKKKLWETIGEISKYKKKKSLNIKRLTSNGKDIRDPKAISNCLNDHFNSIGHKMAKQIHNPNYQNAQYLDHIPVTQPSIEFIPITLDEIIKLIRGLEPNKAPGPDGIGTYIIKHTEEIIAPVLVTLYNTCMDHGTFPDKLKRARIVPLHKGGATNEATNYRPISLLPLFAKLFEKVIKNRLLSFLEENNVITEHQYGFRKSYSTELAIIDIQNTLLSNLENNKISCTIFLDLAKAFDSVNHEILLRKLDKYGIRGMPLQLLTSYLTNRQHLTKHDGIESDVKFLDIGVPQGSILGPILFLLFINDLPLITEFRVKLFADDTFLALEGDNPKSLQKKTNSELYKVSKWFSANKLTLNVSKSKFMIVKRSNKKLGNKFVLKFNGKKMEQCTSYKYLGVHLDENLNWKTHVKYICGKLSKMCGIFAKLRHCCSKDLLKVIYFALVESHLQYCNIIWGDACENTLKPLVNLQNKILKILCFSPFGFDDVDDLYTDMKLLNLKQLHKLSKAKFVYKYKNQKLPSSFENFFMVAHSQHNYSLRSRDTNDYQRIWGKTQYGMKKLQYSGVHLWNTIPHEIRNSISMKIFKKKYKEFLIGNTSDQTT